jgi:tetratricopeptide (TPR) repeat protein
MAEIKRAYELDPLSPIINMNLSLPLFCTRQYDRSIESLQKTLRMYPNFSPTHFGLGMAYERKGMYKEAITELQKAIELSGSDTGQLDIYCALAYVYAVSDRKDKAQDILDQVEELSKLSYVSPSSIAMIYTGLRDKDQAFAWLEKAYEERDAVMESLKVEPVWDSLRSDPRFADLLRRIGLAA